MEGSEEGKQSAEGKKHETIKEGRGVSEGNATSKYKHHQFQTSPFPDRTFSRHHYFQTSLFPDITISRHHHFQTSPFPDTIIFKPWYHLSQPPTFPTITFSRHQNNLPNTNISSHYYLFQTPSLHLFQTLTFPVTTFSRHHLFISSRHQLFQSLPFPDTISSRHQLSQSLWYLFQTPSLDLFQTPPYPAFTFFQTAPLHITPSSGWNLSLSFPYSAVDAVGTLGIIYRFAKGYGGVCIKQCGRPCPLAFRGETFPGEEGKVRKEKEEDVHAKGRGCGKG
ncbi:hypothetical protein Pcinc_036573 [Petrolisthes cinctipes]|uniref:Uncharacterized protein n=1 Tax=Petrolisthes cinctipes TaxID=88211 RepID=A0AAE1BUR0_PETCI|nr:hypothetical protein Pcinc_036573 [Petrolisthes cinctipes]